MTAQMPQHDAADSQKRGEKQHADCARSEIALSREQENVCSRAQGVTMRDGQENIHGEIESVGSNEVFQPVQLFASLSL
jgi:hypothetical protein